MPPTIDDPLSRPYREVRRVVTGVDSPFPGVLCRVGSEEVALLVDVDDLPAGWRGWDAAADGHLLSPLDVIRRHAGHAVRLPVFARRLADLLDGSTRGGLDDGEAVTVAVSLLRGLAELRGIDAQATGEWWLADDGRPILVTGVGRDPAIEGTARAMEAVAAGRGGAVWGDACAGVRHPLIPAAELLRIEDALFAWAPAAPVGLHSGTSGSGVASARRFGPAFGRREELDDDEPRSRTIGEAWGRHLDADLAEMAGRVTTDVWRRLRASREAPARRRAWLTAAVVAGIVVVAGLAWPSEEAGTATADPMAAAPSASPTSSASATPTQRSETADEPSPPPDEPAIPQQHDLVAVASALLGRRSACGDDQRCLAEVMLSPATSDAGAASLPASQRAVTLLDEFGGVAVLRVDDADHDQPSQLVVIQLEDDRWLVRDIHAAHQP